MKTKNKENGNIGFTLIKSRSQRTDSKSWNDRRRMEEEQQRLLERLRSNIEILDKI
ncbi:hypothetical protein KAI04_04195 [Candidatus Pacearchaeota archaeon]|nr:hypothetical protein [Candidatus Pacearchaeota archaeon]